jgi:phosphoglycolate phosphatase
MSGPLPPTAPRALIFDWDNTLVDSWDTIHHALAATFTAMGREPWTLAETKIRVRHALKDSFPKLFGERWEEARKLYLDTFTSIHLERLKPVAGAGELLAALAARGLFLAVVSNKTGRLLRAEADHLGWTKHFRRLVGAGDAAFDKPHAASIEAALEGSGIACGPAVWYVGDTGIDMECAANAGCFGVLMGALDAADQGLTRFPPGLEFAACAALSRHLEGM